MARVFISHAHADKALAAKVMDLLRCAFGLQEGDFFLSSREGTGVALGAEFRQDVLGNLALADALVVLVTPRSAGSPWVWLEAGARLASQAKQNPLFLIPSETFTRLQTPVNDVRAVCLDKEDELHGLVETLATSLQASPQAASKYSRELQELVSTAKRYSLTRARMTAWLRGNAASFLLMALVVALALLGYSFYYWQEILSGYQAQSVELLNQQTADTARQFLILKGRVVSGQGSSIGGATVMASHEAEMHDVAACEEPDCTHDATKTDGNFRLDLTRIKAQNGNDIVLSVVKPGFAFDSRQIKVDVRAMHVNDPGNTVQLRQEN